MSGVQRVLVADPVSPLGVELLQAAPGLEVEVRTGLPHHELLELADRYDAIIVRSQTKITADVLARATRLRAVGRAGVGVDNIDLAAATQHGVVVMNTPGGNTVSTAEHAFSMMMALARRIPQAHASMAAGRWERKQFEGVELHGKTLAVLGMGRIGTEFARRAMAFGMRVVAYDPYLASSRARLLRVELVDELEVALAAADFVSLHMPLSKDTRHILSGERLMRLKPGVRVINCARGGLVDEAGLVRALDAGVVAGAALDVFETEPPAADSPLLGREDVVLTPHLGASTREAQESVGIEIARSILKHLTDGAVINGVNAPSIDEKTVAQIGKYLQFAEKLGLLVAQLAPARPRTLRVDYSGKVSELETTLITRSALKGYLSHTCDAGAVNHINAQSFADTQGLQVTESRLPSPTEFTDLIEVTVKGEHESAQVAGTFFGNSPRVVRINDHRVEANPQGHLLILNHSDTPGQVGQVGTLLGRRRINIANMSVSRNTVGEKAVTVLDLDSPPGEQVLEELTGIEGIDMARAIRL
ncbi:MAG TPA: phosphoglycerate dehydrogenase [Verrucomicrobiales bacterium]|nr:phosphoglycerate dehydrogenase [Verrucomicrobiales bacterium]